MIFYFSGTGNSLYAAKSIAEYNGEKLISIASIMKSKDGCYEYNLTKDEVIGFVFPIYAWAPPKMVISFIIHRSGHCFWNCLLGLPSLKIVKIG